MKKLPVIIVVALLVLIAISYIVTSQRAKTSSVEPVTTSTLSNIPETMAATAEVEKKARPALVCLVRKGDGESDLVASLIQQLAVIFKNRAAFRFIDIDAQPEMASFYNVQSIPAIIIAANSTVLYKHEGYVEQELLIEELKSAGME
ncbi:thioredoxin family protein [Candidatus Margulisiibacteriota bacterium]